MTKMKGQSLVNKSRQLTSYRTTSLTNDIRALIEEAREHVARAVNSGLVRLYWQIGKRLQIEILKGQRADYGKKDCADIVCKIVT